MSQQRKIPQLFVLLFFCVVLCHCEAAQSSDEILTGKKPNILFIFADDLSFNVIHSLGCDEIETPHIDSLAKRGVVFTHAYNQGAWRGAVCLSSRNMLNTGRFLWQAEKVDRRLKKEAKAGRFWAQYMKKAGYETYFSGKWHVYAPPELVFDNIKNVRKGMPYQTEEGYYRPVKGQVDKWSPYDPKHGGFWAGGKHWSEVLADDSVSFLEQASKKEAPFFMYLSFNAAHDPRQAPKSYVDKYPIKNIALPKSFQPEYPDMNSIGCGPKLRDERLAPFPRTEYAVKVNRQEYYAIINHMDDQIGRIIEALKKSGKYDNTYIIFSADHGLAVGYHGLMGKQNMYEHSMRVPLIICGPGVKANSKITTPVYYQDIMPTSLALAGAAKPTQVQYKSLIPLIEGKRQKNYESIYGAYMDLQRMVTHKGHKLIYYPKIKKTLVFDLVNDPEEMNDLSKDPSKKQLIKQLFVQLKKLQKETGDTLQIN